MEESLAGEFLRFSANKLRQLAQRIDVCLGGLNDEQIWARGSDNQNAIGNLALHLCGNLRQWIGAGVAGKPDIRVRDREFSARGEISVVELRERLKSTVEDTAGILEGLPVDQLARRIEVQGYTITVLEAIYSVVEHFGQHTGQILFATKMLTGGDLGFYGHLSRSAHGEKTP